MKVKIWRENKNKVELSLDGLGDSAEKVNGAMRFRPLEDDIYLLKSFNERKYSKK